MSAELKIIIKKQGFDRIRHGHPWVYRGQIEKVDGKITPGALADVFCGSEFAGIGYYNEHSQISLRMLTMERCEINAEFFKRRIERAMQYRARLQINSNAYRVVSGEADALPGLVIDRYDDVFITQFLTHGMDRLRPLVFEAMEAALHPKGIFERSDSSSRKIEGLKNNVGWVSQNCGAETVVYEDRVKYKVRFGEGQKTGLYLDQRDNRIALGHQFSKIKVLDAFCNSGGFGLHLAARGCRVLGIDSQEDVVTLAKENAELNGFKNENIQFRIANIFDELKAIQKTGETYDLVILDPPSFVKKKEAVDGAISGYKEIVMRALKLLNDGGSLAVFSCSYHVDESLLMGVCMSAAVDMSKSLRLIAHMKQSLDHPIDILIPETYYLKGYMFEVEG